MTESEVTVIAPPGRWPRPAWGELIARRDLFFFLVTRDIKVIYKQTVLGFGWALIRPLLSMLIFTVIFGKLAQVASDGAPYPVFNYTGIVPWTYFSTALTASAVSLVGNQGLLTKVYFPRMIFPMTPVLSGLIDFAIASVFIAVLMAYYGIAPTPRIVFLPVLVLLMVVTASGIGMWLCALAVLYRDVKHVMPFLTQILLYAAPVVWPASLIRERFGETAHLVFGLYPMAGVIEGFRSALLDTVPMPWDLIGMGAVSAALLFLSGSFYFAKMERGFADVA